MPDTEVTPNVASALQELDRYDDDGRSWDRALFKEAFEDLRKRFQDTPPAEREALLREWFFDATRKDPANSAFTANYAIRVPQVFRDPPGLQQGRILALFDTWGAEHSIASENEIRQYGPCQIISVAAGNWAAIQVSDESTVLGSKGFTFCTPIVARSGDTVFIGHALGSAVDEVQATLGHIKALYGDSCQITVFQPHSVVEQGAPEPDWENTLRRGVAGWSGVDLHSIPHVGDRNPRSNPFEVNSTDVIVTSEGVTTYGLKVTGGRYPEWEMQIVPESIRHYPWK